MKRIVLTFTVMFFMTSLNAQITKGAIALMGGLHVLNLTSTDAPGGGSPTSYNRSNTTNIDFGGLYSITPSIALGLAILAQNSASMSGTDQDNLLLNSSQAQAGARIFGRYYYPCFAPRFYTYGQLYFNFLGGGVKDYNFQGEEISDDNLSTVGAGVQTGFTYFLIPAIALELNFGLFNWRQQTTSFQDSEAKSTTNAYELLAFSKTLQFGFCWYLGRKGQGF